MQLYWKLISASIRSQMEYKFSFAVETLIFMFLMAIDFLLVAAILLKFDKVGGWNLYEVGYMFAISCIVRSVYRMFGNEIHAFDKYTVNGEFDQLLTRPVSPLMVLLSRTVNLSHIGGVLQGLLMLTVCIWGLHGQGLSVWAAIFYLPVTIVAGTIIVFALGIATATFGFWIGRTSDFLAFTFYGPLNAISYPLNIYPGWLKGMLLTLLPVGFITYVPALYLFDKGGPVWYLLLTPLVAAGALGLALRFWKFGIKHYHSAGS